MKDSDWIILQELYNTPNITKVANLLYITQPSLTKRLQNIEEEFGIKVVNRTSKGVEFTHEGELLAQKANEYITFINQVKKELRQLSENEKETIVIGSAYTYSKYVLTEILYEYSQKYPNIRFEVENEQSNILFKKVCDGDVDVAFIRGDYDGNIKKRKIDKYKGYILTNKEVKLEDLPNMNRINYKTNDKTKELIDKWWKCHYGEEICYSSTVGYIDVACKLASKGLGYICCFLPDDYENRENLIMTPMVYPNGEPVTRNTWFTYKENKNMSKTLLQFIKYIEENVAIEV